MLRMSKPQHRDTESTEGHRETRNVDTLTARNGLTDLGSLALPTHVAEYVR